MKPHRYAAAAMALACLAGPALAQTAAPSTSIDISPITNSIIGVVGSLLVTVLTALAGFAIRWINSKTGLVSAQTQEATQQMINERLARAMAYAESVAKEKIPSKIDVNSEFVAVAVKYFINAWPDLAKGIPIDKIRDAIVARLPTGEFTEKADAIVQAKAGAATPETAKP